MNYYIQFSCISLSEKLTIYDSKTPNKLSIIDVLCNEKRHKRIWSTGPNLLIEFESSSRRTITATNGFSAKYRFFDAFGSLSFGKPISKQQIFSLLEINLIDFCIICSIFKEENCTYKKRL